MLGTNTCRTEFYEFYKLQDPENFRPLALFSSGTQPRFDGSGTLFDGKLDGGGGKLGRNHGKPPPPRGKGQFLAIYSLGKKTAVKGFA